MYIIPRYNPADSPNGTNTIESSHPYLSNRVKLGDNTRTGLRSARYGTIQLISSIGRAFMRAKEGNGDG